jgi:ornithine carbamoyltransferase
MSALAAVRAEAGGRELPRHFLELMDLEPATLRRMLELAAQCKRGALATKPLAGRTVALIFEKPSTRTRVSFEVGVKQLGGDVVMLYARDMQSSRGDSSAPPRAGPEFRAGFTPGRATRRGLPGGRQPRRHGER